MYKSLTLRISGAAPLLMHAGSLADPLNPFAREIRKISGKRDKTEADFEQMAKLEFIGGLWLKNGEPCLPGECLEAALIEGAKKKKRGNQAKAGLLCDGFYPLQYDGPRKPEELWAAERFRFAAGVRVQRNRVIRTRPIFRDWAAEIEIKYMPQVWNSDDVVDTLRLVGQIVGIGDWRPKFGRFVVE